MKNLPWLRLWADAVDDDKLRLLDFGDRWQFVAMLCLKAQGVLDDEDLDRRHRKIAVKLGLTVAECETVMKRLVTAGLLTESWNPTNWNKRQFRSDSSTSRVRAFRKRSRNVSETDQIQSTEAEADADTNPRPSAFGRFWELYPKKVKRKTAHDLWTRKSLDSIAERICSDIPNRIANDRRWKAGYVPDPTTYLQQERWNDELEQRAERWV